MSKRLAVATLLLIGVLADSARAQQLAPLVHGWEQFFRLTWEASERGGRPYITGYVSNNWGFKATRVQLLVDGLDTSGRVVSQSVGWLGTTVPPGSRVYFEMPVRERAATYRLSMFAFDWVQTASVQTP